jgi:hypothetical protein
MEERQRTRWHEWLVDRARANDMAIGGFELFFIFGAMVALAGFVVLLIRAGSNLSGDPNARKRDKIGGGH